MPYKYILTCVLCGREETFYHNMANNFKVCSECSPIHRKYSNYALTAIRNGSEFILSRAYYRKVFLDSRNPNKDNNGTYITKTCFDCGKTFRSYAKSLSSWIRRDYCEKHRKIRINYTAYKVTLRKKGKSDDITYEEYKIKRGDKSSYDPIESGILIKASGKPYILEKSKIRKVELSPEEFVLSTHTRYSSEEESKLHRLEALRRKNAKSKEKRSKERSLKSIQDLVESRSEPKITKIKGFSDESAAKMREVKKLNNIKLRHAYTSSEEGMKLARFMAKSRGQWSVAYQVVTDADNLQSS